MTERYPCRVGHVGAHGERRRDLPLFAHAHRHVLESGLMASGGDL